MNKNLNIAPSKQNVCSIQQIKKILLPLKKPWQNSNLMLYRNSNKTWQSSIVYLVVILSNYYYSTYVFCQAFLFSDVMWLGKIKSFWFKKISKKTFFIETNVAKALEYKDLYKALKQHVEKENWVKRPLLSNDSIQQTKIINISHYTQFVKKTVIKKDYKSLS